MRIIPPNVGPYYEDFEVGDIIKHWPGRTVNEADNTWFTLLTLNTHPVHFDENYAKDQMFGKPIVNSTFTLALLAGMTVRDTSQNTIANLGWGDITIPRPVFVGDTIYAQSEVVSKRLSKSRSDAGIISFKQTGFNQDNEIVMFYTRTSLAKRRGYDDGKLPQFGTLEESEA